MRTQTFKAKDVKSAINLVNTEFGDKAIILSTKKNNGLVEVEASDNDEIISDHKKKIEEKKNFSNVFLKELKTNSLKTNINNENKVSYLKNKDFEDKNDNFQSSSKEIFEKIRDDISSLRKEMNGMIVTDQSGISDELSHQTPIKLRQEKFSPEIINKLNYSFIGKNLEDGRVSFFRELSRKLASNDFSRLLKSKNIFIFGNSGSGKSTLAAKLASYLSDAKNTKKINFFEVTNSSTGHSDVLKSYSRVLGFSLNDYKAFDFKNYTDNDEWINIFDFSGEMNFSIQKIKEIKNSFPSFDFCSILTVQSGSNSEMINGITKKVEDIRPMVAITKLDECWVGAEEFSSLALNNSRIGMVTGTKVIIDSIIEANENALTKYMKDNFENV
jgi:flagellar biosynthesis GTPase FlhF